MQNNVNEIYITIYGDYVYFSRGTESYLKERFEILEWNDSLAIVPSDSGLYKIRSTKIGRFACWKGFADFLKNRFPDHKGYFRLVPVPVQRDEFPKGTVALVFNAKQSVDSRYEFHKIMPRCPQEHAIIRSEQVDVFVRDAHKCAKRVDVYKKDRVFAIVANRNGEFLSERSKNGGNHFTIKNPSLVAEMLTVAKRFDYVWRKGNIYYMTDQPELYRVTNFHDEFTRLCSSVPPPPRAVRTSPWGRSSGNYLFFPRYGIIRPGDRVDCYESGAICAFVVHPFGRLTVRKHNNERVGISSHQLRKFLIEKYKIKNIQLYAASAECRHPDYPEDTRVVLLSTHPIPKTLCFDSRFVCRPVLQYTS